VAFPHNLPLYLPFPLDKPHSLICSPTYSSIQLLIPDFRRPFEFTLQPLISTNFSHHALLYCLPLHRRCGCCPASRSRPGLGLVCICTCRAVIYPTRDSGNALSLVLSAAPVSISMKLVVASHSLGNSMLTISRYRRTLSHPSPPRPTHSA